MKKITILMVMVMALTTVQAEEQRYKLDTSDALVETISLLTNVSGFCHICEVAVIDDDEVYTSQLYINTDEDIYCAVLIYENFAVAISVSEVPFLKDYQCAYYQRYIGGYAGFAMAASDFYDIAERASQQLKEERVKQLDKVFGKRR